MYQQHFNFTAPPFSIAPNPRYVYLSPQHREALAHLLYGIGAGGGFIALTGEVGTGKTTLCRCLLEQLPDDVDIALIFNPRLNARELLASICDELHIPHPGEKASIKRLIDLLNHHLLDTHARGRRTIVLIDEAQNLSFDVLEQIRLLTNLETNDTKLLQIVLVGQPELKNLLARKSLRQLSQRITARYHLLPLSSKETEAYIRHRLAVSGVSRRIFSRPAASRIFRLSGGIPRLINLICDRALLGAYTLGRTEVDSSIVGKAASEVLPEERQHSAKMAVGALAVLALLSFAAGFYRDLASVRSALSVFWGDMPYNLAVMQPARMEVPAEPELPSAVASPSPEAPLQDGIEAKSVTVPDFGTLIADPNLTRGVALARLYSLWGVKVPEGAFDECLLARQNGLRCLFSNGNLSQLNNLDHPALLEFYLPDGSTRYATLTGLEGRRWVLSLGKRTHSVEPEQLLAYWRGNFVLLWRPPYGDTGILKFGKKSEAVRWIRDQLNEPATPGKEAVFDAELKKRVMDFQQKHGLLADGDVGPLTLILLQKTTAGSPGPSLGKIHD